MNKIDMKNEICNNICINYKIVIYKNLIYKYQQKNILCFHIS